MRTSLVLALAAMSLAAGCQTITVGNGEVGSGTLKTEDRSIDAVIEVHATAAVVTHVTFGSPASVQVTADDNLLDNVTTQVTGSRLDIAIRGSITTRNPITVTLVVPSLEAATATASARIELAGVQAGALRLRAESSATIQVTGQVTDLDVAGTSAGRLELRDLQATTAGVRLDSAAQAWVRAVDRITGDVSSAGVLTVVGDPGQVDVTTSSSGRIEQD
jgi:hypothetical protein